MHAMQPVICWQHALGCQSQEGSKPAHSPQRLLATSLTGPPGTGTARGRCSCRTPSPTVGRATDQTPTRRCHPNPQREGGGECVTLVHATIAAPTPGLHASTTKQLVVVAGNMPPWRARDSRAKHQRKMKTRQLNIKEPNVVFQWPPSHHSSPACAASAELCWASSTQRRFRA